MPRREKSPNRHSAFWELAPEHVRMAEEVSPGLGLALNERLRTLAHATETTAGLHGTIHIENHLSTSGNQVSGVADATEGTEGINLFQLKDLTTCKELLRILSKCKEYEELLRVIAEDEVTAVGSTKSFWAPTGLVAKNLTVSGWTANKANACQFLLPFNTGFTKVAFTVVAGAAAGRNSNFALYDEGGTQIWELGATETATTGTKTATFDRVDVPAGIYYLAYTQDNGSTTLRAFSLTVLDDIFNNRFARTGQIADTTNADLPATLGTIDTTTANIRNIPAIYFTDLS